MNYEILKLILLAVVLTFMVGSYFTSETFRRGDSDSTSDARLKFQKYVDLRCKQLPKVEDHQCADDVKAVLPECFSLVNDLIFCQQKNGKADPGRCQEKEEGISACVENHYISRLRQRGFSAEKIARLRTTKEKVPSPKGEKDKGSGEGGKEPGKTDQKALSEGPATMGRGDSNSPLVDVEERPGGGEGAGAFEADTNNPSVDIKVGKQHEEEEGGV